ncbi:hypothetical protein GMRT_11470 [Giardia muris]|uniref:Uncharacterized protein n=1 Tax=Giardia muris TaxID=5742 RepID=A0A4Z1SVG8_GIAMU|nr:hypothetical protein GMRT_11470 [Giardia muris]|eukprot:TNJ29774.1 hypothetical protein GMRT_11470 [Giardia muris]
MVEAESIEAPTLLGLPERLRAVTGALIRGDAAVFGLCKALQLAALESSRDKQNIPLASVLPHLGFLGDNMESYLTVLRDYYPQDCPVTPYDLGYVRLKLLSKRYVYLGSLFYDVRLVVRHYQLLGPSFQMPLDIIEPAITVFLRALAELPAYEYLFSAGAPLTHEEFRTLTDAVHKDFLAYHTTGDSGYLDARDAFEMNVFPRCAIGTISEGMSSSLGNKELKDLFYLAQILTEEQVDVLEKYLIEKEKISLDEEGDLVINFTGLPPSTVSRIDAFIRGLITQDQLKQHTGRMDVIDKLIERVPSVSWE